MFPAGSNFLKSFHEDRIPCTRSGPFNIVHEHPPTSQGPWFQNLQTGPVTLVEHQLDRVGSLRGVVLTLRRYTGRRASFFFQRVSNRVEVGGSGSAELVVVGQTFFLCFFGILDVCFRCECHCKVDF